jgi:hypothetical protein
MRRAFALVLACSLPALPCCTRSDAPPEPAPAPPPSAAQPSGAAAHPRFLPAAPGALDAVVRDAMTKASAEHRRLVVYAGYTWKLIPLFALPQADGRASGMQVEGGIKGEGAVGYIAPRLKAMLER